MFNEKLEIAYWFTDDCKNPGEISVKEAYELGFNRAFELLGFNRPFELLSSNCKTEKKYRPYTLAEFVNTHNIGDSIIYRLKPDENNPNPCELHRIYAGYDENPNVDYCRYKSANVIICLGDKLYSLFELFNYFEMFVDCEWKPFGVIDDEECD